MSSPEESSSSSPPAAASGSATAAPAENPAPPAAATPAAGASPPASPQINLAELLALAKTVLAQQQQQAGTGSVAPPPPTVAAPAPAAAEPRAWERKKFFKLTPEQAAAAAAARAGQLSPAAVVATDPAGEMSGAAGGDGLAYGAPAAAALAVDPLAPMAATDGTDDADAAAAADPEEDVLLAGDDVPRRRRGARITPQLGRTTRPPRKPSRLPLWISAITLAVGLGLGWVVYPRLQKPVPPPTLAPETQTSNSKAPATAELMALPPLPPDSVAARANAPEPATARALVLVDQGLTAEKAREIDKAARLYEQAYNEDARVPGAAYRLAEIAMRRGDFSRATLWVNRALAVGENTAACFGLRGVLAVRGGNLRAGISSLTAATNAEPLNSRWYFFLAQMLRRGGRLQEAEQRIVQAIARAEEPQQEEYFNFILRLTRIELGQGVKFLPELQTKLNVPNPQADWLLTGAALELQRGRLAEAATLMGRAFQNQSRIYAASRLDDVYFRNFETTKELSPFYATYLPRGSSAPDPAATSRSGALVSPGLMPSVTQMQQPPGQQDQQAPLLLQQPPTRPAQGPGQGSGILPMPPAPGGNAPLVPGPSLLMEPTPANGGGTGDKP